ncbi:hypothetical protein ACGFX2_28290 [Streptomyces goshikiensis]|uniref:hypothetical protein n=1 Tax=Streptomyces goshikiensis TaxID=1942 RepID=UPI00371B46E5
MSTTPPTGPAGTSDPEDRGDPPGDQAEHPPGGPAAGTPDTSSRRVTRWLSGSYRWQSLLAALVAAAAGIVVAVISRDPEPQQIQPRPPGPTDVRSEAEVVTTSTRQDVDPASPPSGVAVTFEGTFSGLARDARLFAMVLRGKDRADWPVALAELDWPNGTWRAVVRVAEPKPPLEYTTGVIRGVRKAPLPAASVSGVPLPSAPPDDALERLRRDGPQAEGITGTAPFRPVAPGSGSATATASASASPQRRTG